MLEATLRSRCHGRPTRNYVAKGRELRPVVVLFDVQGRVKSSTVQRTPKGLRAAALRMTLLAVSLNNQTLFCATTSGRFVWYSRGG